MIYMRRNLDVKFECVLERELEINCEFGEEALFESYGEDGMETDLIVILVAKSDAE